jgi:hypothetical protein
MTVRIRTDGSSVSVGSDGRAVVRSARGRYVRGGSNLLTTVAERGAGDEVILPLDNPGRIRQLLASNGVGSRIFDAVGDGSPAAAPSLTTSSATSTSVAGAVTGVHVDHLEIHDDTSRQSLAQMASFILAGI